MEFENRYYTNKEIYKEFVNKILCRKMFIIGITIFVVALIMCIISIKDNTVVTTMEGVAAFIALFSVILAPNLTLSKYLELDGKLHNGEHPETIVIFDDKITLKEGKQVISIDYSQITNYYRLKSCSVLMFSSQNGIIFVEDKFTKGKKEEFEKFILEKCDKISKIENR